MQVALLGLGNVLQRDDGVGATVVRSLAAAYEFDPEIRVEDLGTPGLHLSSFLSDLDAVVLVDTVRAGAAPGCIRVYRDEALLDDTTKPRTGPHEPGLRETLATSALTGEGPEAVSLVGMEPADTTIGTDLTEVVAGALPDLESRVIEELRRLGVRVSPKAEPQAPDLWWRREPPSPSE